MRPDSEGVAGGRRWPSFMKREISWMLKHQAALVQLMDSRTEMPAWRLRMRASIRIAGAYPAGRPYTAVRNYDLGRCAFDEGFQGAHGLGVLLHKELPRGAARCPGVWSRKPYMTKPLETTRVRVSLVGTICQ